MALFWKSTSTSDRFDLTTRICPSCTDSTSFGVCIVDSASVVVSVMAAWVRLMNLWSERLAYSSRKLVSDAAAETNNYTWWPGN
ncbi:hypothetical protein K432DRAFT_383728 [Lepidopterella palustris CBS 459.81]|uniref:Uncharacterized protein n=1 Tax=Lepidopterella palustris CBS 459.81 TaxID=1314670 RepID=A0A8E2E776_9PEZI|nr:hypothetical protein K432DRAFT_383728 [Lepidopterella palustris CBS 459.81]